MNEETTLKSALLGGYKKKDVLSYIDSLLAEHDEKVHKMEELISLLTKENNLLKSQVEEIPEGVFRDSAAAPLQPPAKKTEEDALVSDGQKRSSIPQLMDRAQGVYQIAKNKVIRLPDPQPLYRTKEAPPPPDDDEDESEEEVSLQTGKTQEKICAVGAVTSPTFVQNYGMRAPLRGDDAAVLKAVLLNMRNQLEKERQEKQALAAKLEFSLALLIRLYHKNNS